MPMIGLQTERVSPPSDPGETFLLRLALSPFECAKAREIRGYAVLGDMTAGVGREGLTDILAALRAGATAAEIEGEIEGIESESERDRALPPGVEGTVEVGEVGAVPKIESEEDAEDADSARSQYDLDYAAARLVKRWTYRTNRGHPVPIKPDTVQMLDEQTRAWLHDKAWAAIRSQLAPEELAGN